MTNIGIDEILNRLSIKFNRIFYDRDLVECVSQDLQTIINNKNKCCVLVFPSLSPNYLRVVRYQAKLCDLAVISLGSGSAKSIGVCHKKYFLSTVTEEDAKKETPDITPMADNVSNVPKKRRPPIQLYVPPAQRKSRLSTPATSLTKESIKDGFTPKHNRAANDNNPQYTNQKKEMHNTSITKETNATTRLREIESYQPKEICYCTEDLDYFLDKQHLPVPYLSYQCNSVKYLLFKDIFPYAKLQVFSIKRMKHSFHWIKCQEGNPYALVNDANSDDWAVLIKGRNILKDTSFTRLSLFIANTLDFRELKHANEERQNEFQNSHCLCGTRIFFYLPDYMYCCYLSVPDFEVVDYGLTPENYLHCFQDEQNGSLYIEEYIHNIVNCIVFPQISKTEDIDIDSLLADGTKSPQMPLQKEISKCDSKPNDMRAKQEITNKRSITPEKNQVAKKIDRVIVLEERIESPNIGSKSIQPVKDKRKQNEHEQEKEIIRKAKQNMSRKSRPIINYVDDENDTLKIGKGDNINNWEELFNDDGELLDDVFSEIVQKLGSDVTIVKANEDYSSYASKQIEELEHMVELYDFPSTLETHDIISAFSGLKSDSMYVKWVDDTRALLVLGSCLQAQKAIELSNPLIKVRPMSAASSLAREKANQFDLKPAMKRPQTNLQTARRLITSHLGAKSKVSKEQSAKEREDLRIAKEMKKQAKQNEIDAWEGNLRSTTS